VPTTSFRYVEGAATTLHGFNRDFVNVVSFRDPDGDISPPAGCSGVLAVGGMFFSLRPTMTVNGRQFSQAVEADLVFADGWAPARSAGRRLPPELLESHRSGDPRLGTRWGWSLDASRSMQQPARRRHHGASPTSTDAARPHTDDRTASRSSIRAGR
jgi:hypothetical protein